MMTNDLFTAFAYGICTLHQMNDMKVFLRFGLQKSLQMTALSSPGFVGRRPSDGSHQVSAHTL